VPASLVVVGNGMTGFKLCERLVALAGARKYRIIMFGEEPRPAYDRVHLTRFLAGATPEELQLAPEDWYRDNGIELVTGDPVVFINREQRIIRTQSGREERYDRLVFATGSRAFVPEIPGHDLPGVFVYRTLEDLELIKSMAARSRRAAVLGGGLLGLEAAKALKDLGVDTWVVERGTSLLARQLDPEGGALLQSHVERLGIHVCTSRQTESIEALTTQGCSADLQSAVSRNCIPLPARATQSAANFGRHADFKSAIQQVENLRYLPARDLLLQFNTGECLRAQMVLIAAGIRPRDELAVAAGLKLAVRGGIEVNDKLETSDSNIYAIGECASHRGEIYGLAAPGYKMANVLAGVLLGKRRRFDGADQSTWLKLAGTSVATLGQFQGGEETISARTSQSYRRVVLEKGRVVGASAIGDWPEQARVMEAIERGRRLYRWERARFVRSGSVWSERVPRPVSDWPASAIICNCMGIRRAELSAACAAGCSTVEQLMFKTRASTVCGSCRPLLAELVGAPLTAHRIPGTRWLLGASMAALVAVILISLLGPVPFTTTVQGGFKLDVLWRESLAKQITGFTLVGLVVLGMVLSLRKRIPRFRLGEVSSWRAVHAVLGSLTLIALITHTGFRLGQNLNLILMLNFLGLALVGALAGGVTALERRLAGPAARRLRAVWTGMHIALVWPLPVLIAIHVMVAYWF
jgi:nitrite reductase (NADH) large subunit